MCKLAAWCACLIFSARRACRAQAGAVAVAAEHALVLAASTEACKKGDDCKQVPGQYCLEAAELCVDTTPGHARNNGSYGYFSCKAGTFAGRNALYCSPCGPGNYSLHDSSGACHCAAKGHKVVGDGTHQQECSPGTFAKEECSEQCDECPAGTVAAHPGASTCPCAAAGHEADASRTEQVPCQPGHYNPTECHQCQACPTGRFSNVSGAHECVCAPGGHGTNADRTSETPCSPGYYNPERCGSCTKCEPGKYAHDRGAHSCKCAAKGHYATSDGIKEKECEPGHYQDSTCGSTCLKCELGKYAYTSGHHSCQCAAKGHSVSRDGTAQIECGPGFYADEECSPECVACPPGRYSNASVSSGCHPVPAGAYQDQDSQVTYKRCEPGTFSREEGCDTCASCSVSYFSGVGSTACESCFRLSFALDHAHSQWSGQCAGKLIAMVCLLVAVLVCLRCGCIGKVQQMRQTAAFRREIHQLQVAQMEMQMRTASPEGAVTSERAPGGALGP